MNIEFLGHKSVDLSLSRAIPRHIAEIWSVEHIALAHTVPATRAGLGTANIASSLLVLLVRRGGIECSPRSPGAVTALANSIHVMLLAGIFIVDAATLFSLGQRPTEVDAVIVAQVVEADVVHGVVALLGNQLHDAVSSAVDRVVLELHNGSGSEGRVIGQITSETGHRGDDNEHLVLLTRLGRPQDSFHDRSADLVLHGLLGVTSGSDEELVLDVDEMLTVADDRSVGIGDGVLRRGTVAPFRAATHNLAAHVATRLGVRSAKGAIAILVLMNLTG